MATVHIINPTYAKSTKTLKERIGKYKHRPVFYSRTPEKLGTRSEFKKLNPKKGSSKMAAKTKTKRYRSRKRTAAYRNPNPVKRYRYRSKAHSFRKARRRRRNPDGAGAISATSVAHVIGGGIAGAFIYKMTTGIFQTEGNGKYLLAIVLAIGGGWLLTKVYKPIAAGFAAGVAGASGMEYLQENDVISGLLGNNYGYTPQDVNMLAEWSGNYDSPGMLGMVPGNEAPAIPLNNQAAYVGMDGNREAAI